MKFALFYVWEDAKSGLIEIIPLICTSVIWAQYPVFFSSWVSPVCSAGGDCSNLFPSWVSSRLTSRAAVMWWSDSCNILCLLIWQAIFFIQNSILPMYQVLDYICHWIFAMILVSRCNCHHYVRGSKTNSERVNHVPRIMQVIWGETRFEPTLGWPQNRGA